MFDLTDKRTCLNKEAEEIVVLPKDAQFILNAGWMASPVSNWEISYFVSKEKNKWVLWSRTFDENIWDYVTEKLLKNQVEIKSSVNDEITKLLVEHWSIERNSGLGFGPDYITSHNIINEKTIQKIINQAWGENE